MNKDKITARSVDNWPKEPTFGPSTCSVCGESTPLPGEHKCSPTYKQLQSRLNKAETLQQFYLEGLEKRVDELTAANEENKQLREVLEKLARLGNEPHLGNSDGNRMAQQALKPQKKT